MQIHSPSIGWWYESYIIYHESYKYSYDVMLISTMFNSQSIKKHNSRNNIKKYPILLNEP